ncbi:hypothetical protein P7C70_g3854, partial [Phenoliferia sp. Uapishka_3]
PRDLPTPIPASPSFQSRTDSHINSLTQSAGPTIANAALKNTSATSAALRNAGFSAGAANAAAGFGSKHSKVLAPHVANAAQSGWANRGAVAGAVGGAHGGSGGGATSPPVAVKPVAVRRGPSGGLAGLSSSTSIAGGFNTADKKSFGKSLFASKGPMSSEEAKKNVFREPLATKAPARVYSPPTTSYAPPPMRGAVFEQEQDSDAIGSAEAIYDYAGTEADDLGVQDGEVVAVLEHGEPPYLSQLPNRLVEMSRIARRRSHSSFVPQAAVTSRIETNFGLFGNGEPD